MARTSLAVQVVTRLGLKPTLTAANAEGHSVVNDARTVLHVRNGGQGACAVTVETPAVVDVDLQVADRTVSVPAGEERILGPYPIATYSQNGGVLYVDFDQVTTVTIAATRY